MITTLMINGIRIMKYTRTPNNKSRELISSKFKAKCNFSVLQHTPPVPGIPDKKSWASQSLKKHMPRKESELYVSSHESDIPKLKKHAEVFFRQRDLLRGRVNQYLTTKKYKATEHLGAVIGRDRKQVKSNRIP